MGSDFIIDVQKLMNIDYVESDLNDTAVENIHTEIAQTCLKRTAKI